jgi:predicted metal-binding membrane protein
MVLLVVFGVMNVAAMVVVAAALTAERLWFPGATFRRVMGLVSVAAIAVIVADPAVAAGLRHVAKQMRM